MSRCWSPTRTMLLAVRPDCIPSSGGLSRLTTLSELCCTLKHSTGNAREKIKKDFPKLGTLFATRGRKRRLRKKKKNRLHFPRAGYCRVVVMHAGLFGLVNVGKSIPFKFTLPIAFAMGRIEFKKTQTVMTPLSYCLNKKKGIEKR